MLLHEESAFQGAYLSASGSQLSCAVIVRTDQRTHMDSAIQKEVTEDPAGGPLRTSSSACHQYLWRARGLQHEKAHA